MQPYSSAGTTVLSHSALVLQLNTNPCRAVFKLDLCSNKYRLKNRIWWLYLEYPGRDVRITTSLGVGGFFFSLSCYCDSCFSRARGDFFFSL